VHPFHQEDYRKQSTADERRELPTNVRFGAEGGAGKVWSPGKPKIGYHQTIANADKLEGKVRRGGITYVTESEKLEGKVRRGGITLLSRRNLRGR
jgi:hypothetical protein